MNFIKYRYKEVLVWLAYFLLLFSIAHDNWGTIQNGAEVSLFMVVVHFIIFYGNYYVLMPLTFAKKKYLLFTIGSIVFISIWVILTYLVFHYAFQSGYWTSPIEFKTMEYFRPLPKVEYIWTGRISLSGLNVFFISILYFYAEQDKLLKQRMWALEHEKVQAEVKLLRMQINPHFLFNALNNIYAQAVLEESKVADSIHKLSGLLRYTLYDCDTDEVSLMREIEYIDNYIDLQELKEPVLEHIDFRVEGNIRKAKIAPMLLISFIENAFKHGNLSKGGWIRIELKAKSTELLFKCTNSVATIEQQKDPASGIGLKNVKKRLNLNYPNRHQLTINKSIDQFEITLKLNHEHNLPNN